MRVETSSRVRAWRWTAWAVTCVGLVAYSARGETAGAVADSHQYRTVQQSAQPTVQFFVPPLPSQGHKRDQPVSEWSYLDDTDSVFVTLKGVGPSDTVAVTVDVYVRRVPWEGEVTALPDSVAKDTAGHWITWSRLSPKVASRMEQLFGGRVLSLIHPTAMQASPRLALKREQFVTKIRVCLRINGQRGPIAEINLLHAS